MTAKVVIGPKGLIKCEIIQGMAWCVCIRIITVYGLRILQYEVIEISGIDFQFFAMAVLFWQASRSSLTGLPTPNSTLVESSLEVWTFSRYM